MIRKRPLLYKAAPVMIGIVLLLSLMTCETGYEISTEEEEEQDYNPATVKLSNFTYTGTKTAHLALYEGYTRPNETSNYTTYAATVDSQGGHDVVFDDIMVGGDNDKGQDVSLYIGSDEDGSGEISADDMAMPVYRFTINPGRTVDIDWITFDAMETLPEISGDPAVQAAPVTELHLLFAIEYEELGDVSPSQPLFLRVDWGNGDFSTDGLGPGGGSTDLLYQIPIMEKDRVYELLLITVPVPTVDTDFYALMWHDTDGDGQPTAGEPASEASALTNITHAEFINSGSTGEYQFDLTVSGNTLLQ